jgi:hypothetical protein
MANIIPSLPPAMPADLIASIYRHAPTSCWSPASIGPPASHRALHRRLHSGFPRPTRLGELFAPRMIHQGGHLVLDDTTRQRQTAAAGALANVGSSSAGGVRLGRQVVLLVWAGGNRKVPTSMRWWQKGGESEVGLATERSREAAACGVPPNQVLFDRW